MGERGGERGGEREREREGVRGERGREREIKWTDLVLTLHQQIKEFWGVDNSLTEVGHESYESSVPFVDNLCEGCRARCHQDLPHSVVKLGHGVRIHTQETLSSALLGNLHTHIHTDHPSTTKP